MFSHAFEILIPCLTISFGELTERVSLNVAKNDSLTRKENLKNEHFEAIILKQKWMSTTKVNCVFWMTFSGLYLEQLHIFWKCVHAFHRKQPPMVLLEVIKSRKLAL